MPMSRRWGRTGAGCGRCLLLGVSALTSPSLHPQIWKPGQNQTPPRLLGAFLLCNLLSTKQKRKVF